MLQPARVMRKTTMFLVAALLAPTLLNAGTNPRPITLAECVSLALSNNLGLQIERINPTVARLSLNAALGGYDPELRLSADHNDTESGSRLLGGGFSVPGSKSETDSYAAGLGGLLPWGMTYDVSARADEQTGESYSLNSSNAIITIPFQDSQSSLRGTLTQSLLKNSTIDGTRLNIRISRIGVQQSDLALRYSIMTTVTEVELSYYNLFLARESVKVQEKAVELAEKLVQENKRRVEVGAMAPLDEKQAESQAASSRADLLQAQRGVAAAENALKQKLTDDFASWANFELIPAELLKSEIQVFDIQNSWGRGLSDRPDLLQAKLDIEAQGVRIKYNRNQVWPQLDVYGTYGYNGSGSDLDNSWDEVRRRDRPFWVVGGQFSIPLGNRTARNSLKSSKATLEQLLLSVKSLEQGIMVQIDDAMKLAKASYERIKATRESREYSEAALEAEQKKLESGKSTSFEVLRLQRDLTSASSEEIRALTEYNRNLAQLSLAEATTFKRLGLTVDGK
jgi:outer membrane protein TolC